MSGTKTTTSPCECKQSIYKKLGYSACAAGIFLLLANSITYGLIDRLFGGNQGKLAYAGRPKIGGLLISTIVFFIIVFLLMKPWKSNVECDT
jgi:hypothetical protein